MVDHLPDGKTLVDLFAGGCAVTHAAMLEGRWNRYIANDIGDASQLFCDAVHGKYHDEKRWISREDFFRLKDVDPYVKYCWSFGNNGCDYMYAKTIEAWKKALHFARVYGDNSLLKEFGIDSEGSIADIKLHMDDYSKKYSAWVGENVKCKKMHELQSLESLERLQSLERLERLQSLERLQVSRLDYREVKIPEGAVVYADPPYRNTNCGHYGGFDVDTFDDWLASVPVMVIVSEYVPPRGCVEVAAVKKFVHSGTGNKSGANTEKLFVQERFVDEYHKRMNTTEQMKMEV